ncbi:MAG TPA: bifunctional hydroxymethylpyrimidine kinase/phosphomethylpyrimidine kinase, partial [Acidimicrobiales bacterium]|nr:bifunctional hydroxymethylpyrimidine kinase/phosphomethylpyrimidine kinase [Acidimicrobiales bacterium]
VPVTSTPPVALVVAGSDSGGGAGVQADLKTFAAFGVFATTAITALTAQNTRGVASVHVTPPEFVVAQIDAVLADFSVRVTKTGMLATAEIVELVAARAATGALPALVVDPVMVASSGDRLLEPEAERAYVELLFPHAAVVTPNLREAAILVGRPLETVADMGGAARELGETGAGVVVIKGGHLEGDAVDVAWDGEQLHELPSPRVVTRNNHGTGCSLASAVAAGLALGHGPLEALEEAKRYVHRGLEAAAGWHLGGGRGPIEHFTFRRR